MYRLAQLHSCTADPEAGRRAVRTTIRGATNLLRTPLPLVGASVWMERGCQQNSSLAHGVATNLLPSSRFGRQLSSLLMLLPPSPQLLPPP